MTLVAIEYRELESLHTTLMELKVAVESKTMQDVMMEVMDGEQAAKYLKISKKSLYTLKDRGEIEFSQHDRMMFFRKADLDEWVLKNRVGRKK